VSSELSPGVSLPRFRIDRDGDWFSEDGAITHEGIVANLRENLKEEDGRYFVQAGRWRLPVEVEDTPFTAVRVETDAEGAIVLLNDGSRERLDPTALRFTEGGVPYCRVKGGRFEARLTRAAAYQLGQLLEYDEASHQATLVLAGARYPLVPGRKSDPYSGDAGAPSQRGPA
jgi:hypothetical protein